MGKRALKAIVNTWRAYRAACKDSDAGAAPTSDINNSIW